MGKKEKNIEKLADDLLKRLSDKEREELAEKLDSDQDLAELKSLVGDTDSAALSEWEKLRQSAHSLLKGMLKDTREAGKNPRQERGIVTYDSQMLPLPDGVRPALVDTRRVRYQVGDQRLELSLYPVSPKSYELIGQLSVTVGTKEIKIELSGGQRKITAQADQFGVFHIERLPGGKYHLKIIQGESLAVVDLEI